MRLRLSRGYRLPALHKVPLKEDTALKTARLAAQPVLGLDEYKYQYTPCIHLHFSSGKIGVKYRSCICEKNAKSLTVVWLAFWT